MISMEEMKLSPEAEFALIGFQGQINGLNESDLRTIAVELYCQQLVTKQTLKKMGFSRVNGFSATEVNQICDMATTIARNVSEERMGGIVTQHLDAYCYLSTQVENLSKRLDQIESGAAENLKEHEVKGIAVSSIAAVLLMVLFAVTMKAMGA